MSNLRKNLKQYSWIRWIYFTQMRISHRILGTIKRMSAISSGKNLNLNLGCGATKINQFIGADIYTGDVYVNLLKPLPFTNNTVHRVYMHHVLEHFALKDAEKLVSEIYRILRPGGRVRFVVPDISVFLNRPTFESKFNSEMTYYAGNTTRTGNYKNLYMLALNEMFYMGDEHKFMYDEDFLIEFLSLIGFKNIIRTSHGQSQDSIFAGIDPHQGSALSTTSLCIEAEK